ncbi:putative membrane protein [Vibrio parahaemolyticus AQ3810]|nr:putative membrane protein [Vibrio parahaemolyticus AQ3810]
MMIGCLKPLNIATRMITMISIAFGCCFMMSVTALSSS